MQPKCYLRMGSEVYVIQCYDNPSVNLGMALSYLAHRMKQRKCKICLENWQERCERCERDCYGHEQGKMMASWHCYRRVARFLACVWWQAFLRLWIELLLILDRPKPLTHIECSKKWFSFYELFVCVSKIYVIVRLVKCLHVLANRLK